MAGALERAGPGFRRIALPLSLGIAVFAVASYCMLFPRDADGAINLWLSSGVTLAVLLRLPERQWAGLVVAALVGHAAAGIHALDDDWLKAVVRALVSAPQYILCALILRWKLGSYFDLTDLRHLRWLAVAGAASTLLRMGVSLIFFPLLHSDFGADVAATLAWAVTLFLGLFVLALPILAITSRGVFQSARVDFSGALLLAAHIAVLTFIFGPGHSPGIYLVMPSLMLLAWRHGLLGAGVGALLTVAAAAGLFPFGSEFDHKLLLAGYGAAQRGIYLELFFSVAILTSLPLAVARARQRAMETALTDALTASERRAVQLAQSEASARAAEADALEAQERLRRIIETSSDIICTIDHEGRFIEISENCQEIWGWPRQALLGRRCFDFMGSEDRERSARDYQTNIDGGSLRMSQNVYVRPDGTGVPMSWSATWIEQERISHCIGRDMTEYNALATQAQLSQRMEAIGQLTGGVAHDFNNLLTIVIGSSETIAEETVQPPLRRLAELILKAARQGGELTRQLLAFSRRQPLEPRPLDVNALLDSTVPLIRRTLGADLQFSIETSVNLRRAYADPTQTEAAILNLCLNARDAMPQGGQLRIVTENSRLSEAYVRMHPEARVGDYVAIHISDTGTGIAPDVIERMFEPFFTTKDMGKGSGLGLSMVYGFIQQSGGHIALASELDKGTTFTLHLPVAAIDAPDIASVDRADDVVEGGSETVLIVEDNDMVREHVRGQFVSLGYHVVEASTGAEALEVLEQRTDIDLLFTDIVMPGGMNGRELGEIAAARWPSLRTLYTSGYSRDALTQDGRLVEGVTLLSKPYSKSTLAEKVRAVLGEGL